MLYEGEAFLNNIFLTFVNSSNDLSICFIFSADGNGHNTYHFYRHINLEFIHVVRKNNEIHFDFIFSMHCTIT